MRIFSGILIVLAVFTNGALAETWPSPPGFSWTGFYAGLSLGALASESRLNANHGVFLNSGLPLPNTKPYREHMGATDVLPGIQAGYNHQLGSGLVLGGELDFTYPDSSSEFVRSIQQTANLVLFDKFTIRNRLQGAIKGRLGYTLANFLPYITAGVSFADTGFRYENEIGDLYKKNTVQTGWVLGAGLEYALFGNFSLRTEYLYTDYGDPVTMPVPVVANQFDASSFSKADLISHTVRAALNYRF